MWKSISKVGGVLTKAESYWSLAVLVSGTSFSNWLVNQWEWVASQGWAAALVISIVLTSVVMIAVSASYWAAHTFRKGRHGILKHEEDRETTTASSIEPESSGDLPDDVRREFASFVITKLTDRRLLCARMLMKLATQLCRSSDRVKKWVGWGAADAGRNERDAWDVLNAAVDSAKTQDELEEAFAEHYKAFVLQSSWILRAAFTLGCLDSLRESDEFRKVSESYDIAYSEVRCFVLLRTRLRSEIERWGHIDMKTHIPE